MMGRPAHLPDRPEPIMTVETEEQLERLRRIGRIVADCLQLMGRSLEPGMTTLELDAIGERYLEEHGARSAPRVTYGFPGATCISVNHEVAHGVPGERRLSANDLVNIDVSAELGGVFADTGGSFQVPPGTAPKQRVLDATRAARDAGVRAARADRPLNVIGAAIERVARERGMTIIENLGSHGTGNALHEEPGFIPSYFDAKDRRRLRDGMVITIEPFLSTGARQVTELDDGWTLATDPRYFSAQFEHTLVVTRSVPIVVTVPSR
jgi:methionyl aminopeptidase